MIHRHEVNWVWRGTLAEFNASTKKWKVGDILQPTDSPEVRYGTGTALFSALKSVPVNGLKKATTVAATGANVALTAIGGVFADLAAARTAVATLQSEGQTHIAALEAKLDAVIAALKAANLMA